MKGLLVALALVVTGVLGKVSIDVNSHSFVDEYHRTLIFHGVNAVYKIPPYYPTTSGFDSTTTLSDVDAKNLKDWGFNVVRLGVMWPGVEPGARGQYNQTYLDQIDTIVTNLGKQNIQVVLDLHQDLLHRMYCGEGVPDYVYNTCKAAEPAGTKPFPQPAVNGTYPVDANGYPTLDSCLSQMFARYYLSAEVGAAFQCLYDNVDNLWDAMAGFWVTVAKRFSTYPNVLGYELLNEPWAGNVYESPRVLFPQYTEKKYLQPLYQYLHNAIRTVDDQKIIFFEGLTIDYWPDGFTEGPGGAAYNDRQALAYHIYCPTSGDNWKYQVACDAIDDLFFAMRRKDSERMGVGMIMTEFGAAEDTKFDMVQLSTLANLADRFQQSWMYWQFKYYEDITTCTPTGESLYEDDGSVCQHKLHVLSRSYPHATAGTIQHYNYNEITKHFTMSLLPLTTVDFNKVKVTGHTTDIYVNRDLSYRKGLSINISSNGTHSNDYTIQCPSMSDHNIIHIIQNNGIDQDTNGNNELITIEISPCADLISDCTCK